MKYDFNDLTEKLDKLNKKKVNCSNTKYYVDDYGYDNELHSGNVYRKIPTTKHRVSKNEDDDYDQRLEDDYYDSDVEDAYYEADSLDNHIYYSDDRFLSSLTKRLKKLYN